MKVNNLTSQQNFTSRNPDIRLADAIVRQANLSYPRLSYIKLEKSPYKKDFKAAIERVGGKLVEVRELSSIELWEKQSALKAIKNIMKWIKELKAGNCGESAELAALAARVNGFKNIKIGSIKSKLGRSLDHAVLVIDNKNPIIIDAWLGFADYVPNALQKYQNEYKKYFGNLKSNDKMILGKNRNLDLRFFDKINEVSIRKLRKAFPELVIKK